jgi:hypothetical protein
LNDESVDPKFAALLLEVLRKELSDDPAGQDILARFQKAPKENFQALADYLKLRLDDDKAFKERLAGAQKLPAEMRAIVYGGKVERLVQIAEAGTVIIEVGFDPFLIFRRIYERFAGDSSTDAPPPEGEKQKKPKGK